MLAGPPGGRPVLWRRKKMRVRSAAGVVSRWNGVADPAAIESYADVSCLRHIIDYHQLPLLYAGTRTKERNS
jgi:hypothetical protein